MKDHEKEHANQEQSKIWRFSSLAPHFNEKHGHAKRGKITGTFKCWIRMRERCENPNAVNFSRYGGRGIKVCDEWGKFENFLADMGERPPGGTIDRIDNTIGYSKENCRWASRDEQARNKSSNVFYEFNGKKQCVAEWAREYGIDYFFLRGRLKEGWSIEEALTIPKRRDKRHS